MGLQPFLYCLHTPQNMRGPHWLPSWGLAGVAGGGLAARPQVSTSACPRCPQLSVSRRCPTCF